MNFAIAAFMVLTSLPQGAPAPGTQEFIDSHQPCVAEQEATFMTDSFEARTTNPAEYEIAKDDFEAANQCVIDE